MEFTFPSITKENQAQVLRLEIAENQKKYIETIQECLQEAEEYPVWRAIGIDADGVLVGFAMYGLWEDDNRVWLDRFLIDKRHQGQGYAKACLPKLFRKLVKEYGCNEIYLSIVADNQCAERLYKTLGFRFNGELDIHGEKVMKLELQY